jgi:hypothetical protein
MATGQNTLFWTLKYSQADEWRQGKFNYQVSDKHRLIFEGITGSGRGDTAIDDISLSVTGCSLFPDIASPNSTATTTTKQPVYTTQTKMTTTFSFAPQSAFDCNFDSGLCSWTNDGSAELTWNATNGSLSYYNGECFALS